MPGRRSKIIKIPLILKNIARAKPDNMYEDTILFRAFIISVFCPPWDFISVFCPGPILFRFFASANILNLGPGSAGLPASVII